MCSGRQVRDYSGPRSETTNRQSGSPEPSAFSGIDPVPPSEYLAEFSEMRQFQGLRSAWPCSRGSACFVLSACERLNCGRDEAD